MAGPSDNNGVATNGQNGHSNGSPSAYLNTIPQEGHDFSVSLKDKVIASEYSENLEEKLSKF